MNRAIVIGHSHSKAIAEALRRTTVYGDNIQVFLLHAKQASANSLTTREAIKIVAACGAETGLFLTVFHTYHNVLGLVRSGEDFDFLVDPNDTPDPDATVRLPHRAMISAFEEQFAKTDKVRAIIEAANCPAFLLSAPPPKRSSDYILKRFMRPKNRVYRGKIVEKFGIERAVTRLKLWSLEERFMADWAKSVGMAFLPAPLGAFDRDGFLSEDYYDDDVTHANAGYGALVLEQISMLLRDEPLKVLNG
jgi:hypothetical protein